MRKGADCLSKWVGEAERQLRYVYSGPKLVCILSPRAMISPPLTPFTPCPARLCVPRPGCCSSRRAATSPPSSSSMRSTASPPSDQPSRFDHPPFFHPVLHCLLPSLVPPLTSASPASALPMPMSYMRTGPDPRVHRVDAAGPHGRSRQPRAGHRHRYDPSTLNVSFPSQALQLFQLSPPSSLSPPLF